MNVTYLNHIEVDQNTYSHELTLSLLGESIFTSSSVIKGEIPWWPDHRERLIEGVKSFFMIQDQSQLNELRERLTRVSEIIQSIDYGYIRITLFINHPTSFAAIIKSIEELDILIQLSTKPENPSDQSLVSKKCRTLDLGNLSFPSHIKSGSYANQIYWKRTIAQQGFDDYIRVFENKILEASTSNVFLYMGEKLFLTPKIIPGVLSGIARKKLIQYLTNNDYKCHELDIETSMLDQAQEVILTNAVQGICPVVQLNDKSYKKEMAKKLQHNWPWD